MNPSMWQDIEQDAGQVSPEIESTTKVETPNSELNTEHSTIPESPGPPAALADSGMASFGASPPPVGRYAANLEEPDQAKTRSPWWLGPIQALRALFETVVPALLIAIGINLFLAQATQVRGLSMEPSLHTEQRLVVEKVTYHFRGPRRGDIVVIDLPKAGPELLIKRVIGLPGETISSQGGQIFIDGEPLKESYILNSGGRDISSRVIPPLHVFVMGDNRRSSNDSRNFGPVPIDHVVGRAWFSYWPLEFWGLIH